MTEPVLREAVRGLMIDPSDRVLMMKLSFPDWTGWVLPGGGTEAGEDHHTALRRELAEETGVPEAFVGPLICRRIFLFSSLDGYDGQEDHVYLVPCHKFELKPTMSEDELVAEGIVGTRWWTVAEMETTAEDLRPENLAEMTALVLEHGAPATPIVISD